MCLSEDDDGAFGLMSRKYERITTKAPGAWSDWYRPHRIYKTACCGCCLVHDVEFAHDENGRTIFRTRINIRSTAAMRREERKRIAREKE